MKKLLCSVFIFTLFFISALSFATELQDTHDYASCNYCGMDRSKFAHSRMLIEYDDNSIVATCSLHCAAIELALTIDKTPKSIKVGDLNSKQLIDAGHAFWVLGGHKRGVMTSRPKWAFANKAAAEKFIVANDGQLVNFDEAIKAAYEDMYKDTLMIRKKRKMKSQKIHHNGMQHNIQQQSMDHVKKEVI